MLERERRQPVDDSNFKSAAYMTEWITSLIEGLGYLGIALLMFLENLFPPIPSEVIMPLAGYTASQGQLHIAGVAAAGLAGTLGGALFWYGVARWLGEKRLRRFADRHGRWITLSEQDIESLERWFENHSRWAIPIGHLVPGIRTLISIPAGLFKVSPIRFIVLTSLGGGAWTTVLAVAGYVLGQSYGQVDTYLGPASTAIMAAIALWYVFRVITFKRPSAS